MRLVWALYVLGLGVASGLWIMVLSVGEAGRVLVRGLDA